MCIYPVFLRMTNLFSLKQVTFNGCGNNEQQTVFGNYSNVVMTVCNWIQYRAVKLPAWFLPESVPLLCHTEGIETGAYRQTSIIRCTFVGNKIVDHSDQTHLHSLVKSWLQWIGQRQLQDETRNISGLGLGVAYIRGFTVCTQKPFRFIDRFSAILNSVVITRGCY